MDVLNKGKSPDIVGITIEHLLNADEVIWTFCCTFITQCAIMEKCLMLLRKGYCPQFLRRKEVRSWQTTTEKLLYYLS
jgi:hypothetical protein